MTVKRICALFALTPLALGIAAAQTPGGGAKDSKFKPYQEIVTKEAVTQDGVFKVHRIDDTVYFEISPEAMGREMLWQTEVAELPQSMPEGFPGAPMGTRVVRFTRRANKVYLTNVQHVLRPAFDGAIKIGIDANSFEPIIMAFDILTEGDTKSGKSAVINVTPLYTTDPHDISVKPLTGGTAADPSRSYVKKIKAFPTNIETRAVITFHATKPAQRGLFWDNAAIGEVSVLVHYSLLMLPEKPMQGRLSDTRVGYFNQEFVEFGGVDHVARSRSYISRFRLEKKDPTATLSEPVKPIVFYLAREVPEKWRTYIKQGIEDWQIAFESAGFKNAIVAKDAPSEQEDPHWDAEDARYSVIRWAPSMMSNAFGPSVQDPRSGETLSAHIIFWNNITDLLQKWYFMQTAAVDPRARKLPFEDDLMGRLLRYVVCHEVGHTLGLEHNFKASNWFTPAQLRDPKFTDQHGVSCSIMDYSRFNYVAQPGDGVRNLMGQIGVYDHFAIEYGYKPIPQAKTPYEEEPTLNALLAKQVSNPWLRFANGRVPFDPTVLTEDVGGGDRVETTRLGLLNLDRIAKNFLLTSTTKKDEDYVQLAVMWLEMFGQRYTELAHVTALVGGVEENDMHFGYGEVNYAPIPAETQRRAVKFLLTTGLARPEELFDGKIWKRVCSMGDIGMATGMSSVILNDLLTVSRTNRMFDAEARYGARAYSVKEMIGEIEAVIWHELQVPSPKVDIYRRAFQRMFVTMLDNKINGAARSASDLRGLLKESLRRTARRIDVVLPKTADEMTRLHLKEIRSDIEKVMANRLADHSKDVVNPREMMGFVGRPHHGCFTDSVKVPKEILDTIKDEWKQRLGIRFQ